MHSDRKGFNTKKKKGADLRAKRNIEGTSFLVLPHALVLFPLNYSLIMNWVSSHNFSVKVMWMHIILRKAFVLMRPYEFIILKRRSADTRSWMLTASD